MNPAPTDLHRTCLESREPRINKKKGESLLKEVKVDFSPVPPGLQVVNEAVAGPRGLPFQDTRVEENFEEENIQVGMYELWIKKWRRI
jgi:hypothetical protein